MGPSLKDKKFLSLLIGRRFYKVTFTYEHNDQVANIQMGGFVAQWDSSANVRRRLWVRSPVWKVVFFPFRKLMLFPEGDRQVSTIVIGNEIGD